MSIIRFARLNIPVNIELVQKEVTALQENRWQPHLNRFHYEGEWNVLSLRSPGGTDNPLAEAINQEEYADTSFMRECPTIDRLIKSFACDIFSVRLLSLHAGAVIREHTDVDLNFENGEARLHFPVFTNPEVEFFLDNTRVIMREGECWYVNVNLPHRIANKGKDARVHLVIDCKVNEWLQGIFQNNFIEKSALSEAELILRKKETIISTIHELRKQTYPASRELADKLEKQLDDAERSLTINA
jgi:hypothetical protein